MLCGFRMTSPPEDNALQNASHSPSRQRRLIVAGGLSGTVVMTVASRPAIGQENCGTTSIGGSIARGTSLHQNCAAPSAPNPTDWIQTSNWPAPYTAG